MKKALTLLSTLIAGTIAIAWTGAGETSDPVLAAHEIPAAVTNGCTVSPTGDVGTCRQPELSSRWVGKTNHGDLFLVMNDLCAGSDCRAWLVEKTTDVATILLVFDRPFRLHQDTGSYPVIEAYAEISATQGAYSRYEWNGAVYARTANRLVYRVDGRECGTREECDTVASEALKQQQVDRAVKIWENVHGVSWI